MKNEINTSDAVFERSDIIPEKLGIHLDFPDSKIPHYIHYAYPIEDIYSVENGLVKEIYGESNGYEAIWDNYFLKEFSSDFNHIKEMDINIIMQGIDFNDLDKRLSNLIGNTGYEEAAKIFELTCESKNKSSFETLINLMQDRYINGHICKYPHGTVCSQGRRRFYYRGENRIYPTSKASIYREYDCDYIKLFISYLKEYELRTYLSLLNVVNNWNYGTVITRAIAQHYGIKTNLLDITSDFEVALFFACCKFEKGKWLPLTRDDFQDDSSKYGVLFRVRQDIIDLN